jgi:hypothetical protein
MPTPFRQLPQSSAFARLAELINFRMGHENTTPREEKLRIKNPHVRFMFSGVAAPFIDLGNYIQEFGMSYGNSLDDGASLRNDAAQPWEGLKNVGKGIATLILSPFMFIIEKALMPAEVKDLPAVKEILSPLSHFERFIGDILTGPMLILKGLVQLATFPITWFIKMPIRQFVAWGSKIPIEEDRFMREVLDSDEDVSCPYKNMNEKFDKHYPPSARPSVQPIQAKQHRSDQPSGAKKDKGQTTLPPDHQPHDSHEHISTSYSNNN